MALCQASCQNTPHLEYVTAEVQYRDNMFFIYSESEIHMYLNVLMLRILNET